MKSDISKKIVEFAAELREIEPYTKLGPFKASNLRGTLKEEYAVLNDKPGIYKWWATEKQFNEFKDYYNIKESGNYEIYPKKIDGETLYCIYVGKASGQTLKDRLKLYVNKTEGVSTIRKVLAKIKKTNQKDQGISNYIDDLYVSCEVYDMPLGCKETDVLCLCLEVEEINAFTRICNTSENYNK